MYLVWPWKDEQELHEVRTLLYPSLSLSPEAQRQSQQLGVNIINSWKLRRSRLPHSIEATGSLIEACLLPYTVPLQASTLKTVYAAALAKMVTSICDLEQSGVVKRSMMEQARKVGMPEEWVHLRHAVTHGAQPGMRILRRAVEDAVGWMWAHFWRELDGEGWEDGRTEMGAVLGDYQSRRKAELLRSSGIIGQRDGETVIGSGKALGRLVRHVHRGEELLVSVLVEEKLLPRSRKKGQPSLKGLILLWEPLLLQLKTRSQSFHRHLVSGFLEQFRRNIYSGEDAAKPLQLSADWLVRILSSHHWTSDNLQQLQDLRNEVIETCLLYPIPTANRVLEQILPLLSGSYADSLGQLSTFTTDGRDTGVLETEEPDGDIEKSERLNNFQHHGWGRPVDVWNSRPIGA